MPAAETSYCKETDLLKGDIPLPSYMGDGSRYVDMAAEQMDAALGNVYVTPIRIDSTVAANRPAILFLKQTNQHLASGKLILDLAVASEQPDLHAYGRHLLREGEAMLKRMVKKEVVLTGAPPLPVDEDQQSFTGPAIFNEDEESLVGRYYKNNSVGSPQFALDSQGRRLS